SGLHQGLYASRLVGCQPTIPHEPSPLPPPPPPYLPPPRHSNHHSSHPPFLSSSSSSSTPQPPLFSPENPTP
ncbi:unnamed protein product, partial [Lampetra fluviatilis]